MEYFLRTTQSMWQNIIAEIQGRAPDEAFCLGLAKAPESLGRRTYLLSRLVIPSDEEAERHPGLVRPDEGFLRCFYTFLKSDGILDRGYRVVAIHSHPFSSGPVGFSSIDHTSLQDDWKAMACTFGDDAELVSIVLNADGASFDGYVRDREGLHAISRIVVTGETLSIIHKEKPEEPANKELFSRMLLIPDYDLSKVASIRIGLIGAGGLGAVIVQNLAMLGIGENELLGIADHDAVESSNLSRIPFGTMEDIGRPKVKVAERYIKSVRPERKVIAYSKDCFDPKVLEAVSSCDIIIGCVDSDAARFCLNSMAGNFMIPYLDLSAGVIIDQIAGRKMVMSGGQVRLYVPGESPCLLCNLGLSQGDIARELASRDKDERKLLRKAGYLRDVIGSGTPQPSCYNLNQVVSGMGASMLLGYILRGIDYDFASLDLEGMEIVRGMAQSSQSCPYCGHDNSIGNAEIFDIDSFMNPQLPMPDLTGKEGSDAVC